MEQGRKPRMIGEQLLLGGAEYRIEAVEGYGGSTIVYRASYQDGLSSDRRHEVLIKELFPYHPKGLVYRDETGRVRCRPDGKAFMEQCRMSFYKGNQANLDLLARIPEKISGNLNSFEEYGTFYSVLPVHGGRNLQSLLEEGKQFQTLREAASGIKMILDALKGFHDNGILHLDISPDNILILPTYALLIDYNSVWPMKRKEGEICFFSEKEGYTAPEVRLKEEENIKAPADLYSVSAVFFRMLTGHPLSGEAAMGNKIWKSFPKNLDIFAGEPDSAAYKAVSIVSKGLHILARKRYQTIAEMERELDELICRIDQKGVSYSTLFEGSLRELKKRKQTKEKYLTRKIRMDDGRVLSEEMCYERLLQGDKILLRGAGGMGKTQFLVHLWQMGMKTYREHGTILFYIPLTEYQDAGEERHFIRKYLLHHLCCLEPEASMEEAAAELNRLFEQESGTYRKFLFLLDGLNEAGERREKLLREIEELGKMASVGILVTNRMDFVKKYALHQFLSAEILLLEKEEAAETLAAAGIRVPSHNGILDLLVNPMMLALYQKSFQMRRETEEGQEMCCPRNMDDMIRYYLDSLYHLELRQASGNEAKQLMCGYILYYLLPDIAREMKRRKRNQLHAEVMYRLAKKSFDEVKTKSFAMTFPQYLGKTRLMLRDIPDAGEWFDYAVSGQLMEKLNLIEESGEKSFRLMHDNFIDSLAVLAKENRKKMMRYRMKTQGVKAGIGIFALWIAAMGGRAVWKEHMPVHLSKEEEGTLYSAIQRMVINVGICNFQIRGQNEILAAAEKEGVLKGNVQDVGELREIIEKNMEDAKSTYVSYRDGKSHLHKLEDMGEFIPLDLLEQLYQKPEEFQEITEHVADKLKDRLCDEESIYNTYDKRKPLTDAYNQYLDAYARLCAAEYSQMIYSLKEMGAEQAAEEVMDGASEMLALGKYVAYNSQEEITDALTGAKRRLQSAKRAMKGQGLL